MNLSLENRYAIICGSTQGIGLAIARELALMGANCTLIARNETSLQKAVSSLDRPFQQEHNYLVADFTKPEILRETIAAHLVKNPVHILINNTGGPAGGLITSATTEDFTNTFSQHLICNHILATAVIPLMKKDGFGRIINIISTSVKIPLRNLGVSNTIRGAVASWAKTLANEVGEFNITVNNVLPGATSTGRLKAILEGNAKKTNRSEQEVADDMLEEIPAKRFGDPAEIAAVVAFLSSPAASYVNGTSIPVDGGRTGSI